jgi:hypothetical protein
MTPQQYVTNPYTELTVRAARTEALARVYAAALVNGTIPPREAVQDLMSS